MCDKAEKKGVTNSRTERQDRQAEALRANLKRRKSQARIRAKAEDSHEGKK